MPDPKTIHAQICDDHQKAAESYFEVRTTAYAAFQNLVESDEEARKTLIDTGALAVDKTGNIEVGWYKGGEGYEDQTVQGAGNSEVWAGGGATAAIGAIGVPAAAWTAVEHLALHRPEPLSADYPAQRLQAPLLRGLVAGRSLRADSE